MGSQTVNSSQGQRTVDSSMKPARTVSVHRRRLAIAVTSLFAVAVVAGCASNKVTDRHELVTGKIPRPGHIWVYDFGATPAEVPANSALAGQHSEHSAPQTAEQIAAGRKAGTEIAVKLVEQINGMGMTAERAVKATKPQINDIVIHGYILSIYEGDAQKWVAIGLGTGASELKVAAEGFQMTAKGLRKLGGGAEHAGGSKSPGAAMGVVGLLATHNPVGLIVSGGMKVYGEETGKSKIEGRADEAAMTIAGILKQRFQEQGWIN
jgi:hypothetical protein